MGHGFAEAQESPAQKLKNSCRTLLTGKYGCRNVRGQVPTFPKTLKLKGCNLGFKQSEKQGLTFLAFIKNVPQQRNAKPAAQGDQRKEGVCKTVKKAHKTCQIVAQKKVGNRIRTFKDRIHIYNNQGEEKCKQSRAQVTADNVATTKNTRKVVRSDKKTNESVQQGQRDNKIFFDKRRKGIVTNAR